MWRASERAEVPLSSSWLIAPATAAGSFQACRPASSNVPRRCTVVGCPPTKFVRQRAGVINESDIVDDVPPDDDAPLVTAAATVELQQRERLDQSRRRGAQQGRTIRFVTRTTTSGGRASRTAGSVDDVIRWTRRRTGAEEAPMIWRTAAAGVVVAGIDRFEEEPGPRGLFATNAEHDHAPHQMLRHRRGGYRASPTPTR